MMNDGESCYHQSMIPPYIRCNFTLDHVNTILFSVGNCAILKSLSASPLVSSPSPSAQQLKVTSSSPTGTSPSSQQSKSQVRVPARKLKFMF